MQQNVFHAIMSTPAAGLETTKSLLGTRMHSLSRLYQGKSKTLRQRRQRQFRVTGSRGRKVNSLETKIILLEATTRSLKISLTKKNTESEGDSEKPVKALARRPQ